MSRQYTHRTIPHGRCSPYLWSLASSWPLPAVLKLGSALRFVSNAVMVGFISAVGVNIILGQLSNFTGYEAEGANRVVRAINTVVHPGRLHGGTVAIGIATIILILLLERTKLRALGLVAAIVATSAAVAIFNLTDVAILDDLSTIPRSLPLPQAPVLGLVPVLLLPALSLAFVGLVQGAADHGQLSQCRW